MKWPSLLLLITLLWLNSCSRQFSSITPADESLIQYVDPFIGTGGHGHTYPGATTPFGMVQLSPDTRLDGWDGCSGYHYSDEYIYGFSHTHLSGTGVSDYGDILLMPTHHTIYNNGADGKKGYRAHFSHDNEIAEPGYYKVKLDDTNIEVELTATARAGYHRYTFAAGDKQVVILDLGHRDEVTTSTAILENDYELAGHRHSKAWATDQRLFYNIQFSKPVQNISFLKDHSKGKNVVAAITFDASSSNILEVQVGISAVDGRGAKQNRLTEIGTATFDIIKDKAQLIWERQLQKIAITSAHADIKTNFYTALYHTMIAPNIYSDVDRRYRGMDLKVHTADFDYYTVFSLWDTYRATHPLYTLIEQERTNNFIKTFIAKKEEGGIMPIWDLAACYTDCMIGYHAVPVIADAYLKGIRGYDVEKAFEAMKHSATRDKSGLDAYKKYGYIPVQEESESVSKTLEYAYDDWTIAQMAKAMGKEQDYTTFLKRAQYYKNVFDPSTQFMRGRFRNSWFAPFDPYEVNFNYTEANSWQYSFYVPQDISGFIHMLGGKSQLEQQLDKLFTAEQETSGRHQADITGLIGQYAHGNEPSHHMAYLYNFINKPYKTQERVQQILTQLYSPTPDGISGNEDCGQMSAWYVLSAMGFYPVTPGSNQYIIGTPIVETATIRMENGKTFTILAKGVSDTHKYIQRATLKGKPLKRSFLWHQEIMDGGQLVFEMGDKPSDWATKDNHIPHTTIDEHTIVAAPFIAEGKTAFHDKTRISLGHIDKEAQLFYALDSTAFQQYTQPIEINTASTLYVYAQKEGKRSATIATNCYRIDPNINIELGSEYANQYNAGGDNALIDGIKGTRDFHTGTWQGYYDKDMVATIDMSKPTSFTSVSINFLQDQRSWIFYPTQVQCEVSVDGKIWQPLGQQTIDTTIPSTEVDIKTITFTNNKAYQYIRVTAQTLGELPKWHLGYKHDGRSWLFIDEISFTTK